MARAGLDLQIILQTAADLADEKGMEHVTLANLAKKLNVRSPSLYNHVDGLGGLRKKLALYGIRRLNETLTRAAVGRSGGKAVHAIAASYIQFVREHPGVYDCLVRMPDWKDEETRQAAGEIINLIVRLLHAYGLQGEPAVHAVRALHSLLHGFAALEQTGNFNIPIDPDVSLRLAIDAFLAGLQSLQQPRAGEP